MKLRVTFTVNDQDWGPINGFILDKVRDLEVTNAVAIKTAANGHGGNRRDGVTRTAEMLSIIQQAKNGIDSSEVYDRYEKGGASRSAGYQTLRRFIEKGLVTLKDGKVRATAKGMRS